MLVQHSWPLRGEHGSRKPRCELAHDYENIVAIKEASGKLDQVEAIVKDAPAGFDVYSGDDSATLDIMARGGVGVISTIGNVAPGRMKEIVDLAAAGRWDEAAAANERLHAADGGPVRNIQPHPGQRGPEAGWASRWAACACRLWTRLPLSPSALRPL